MIYIILRGDIMELYNEYLKYSYFEVQELFKKSKTKEEQDFYMMLANFILQREQRKIIKEM